jgi:uncharacterized protein YbbC (DUF1343 family)
MRGAIRFSWPGWLGLGAVLLGAAPGASGQSPAITPPRFSIKLSSPEDGQLPPVMLGIDVLEARGFGPIRGRRVGLLTHPAGVNRRGVSTIEVMRRAPGVELVALYAPEHGIHGDAPANAVITDTIDPRTRLPVFSLYGANRKPTRAMLAGIEVLVIDLQDIGTRSYTFVSAMRRALEGCFEHGVEVVVLDRPNPLGGLTVDGPLLDAALARNNYVGAFRVPYVHGLTIGELARMTKEAPSLDLPDALRSRGKLTVIPMQGWTRSMRWPDTGLKWIATSGLLRDWEAVQGYPMTGLATFWDPPGVDIGFRHGVGTGFPFRGLSFKGASLEVLESELRSLQVPGIQFRRAAAPDREGRRMQGIHVDIVEPDAWRPTELNFHLMRLACRLSGQNPFAPAPGRNFSLFLLHLGSIAFHEDLAAKGAEVDIGNWLQIWRKQAEIYQRQSMKYWLYW